jgi:hypothetical protein
MTSANRKTTKFNRKAKTLIAAAGAFVTLATASLMWEQLGLPRWTWFSEHKALAQEYHNTELTRAQLKFYDLDREIKKYEQDDIKPPQSLIREWQTLRLRIQELCTKLGRPPTCAELG